MDLRDVVALGGEDREGGGAPGSAGRKPARSCATSGFWERRQLGRCDTCHAARGWRSPWRDLLFSRRCRISPRCSTIGGLCGLTTKMRLYRRTSLFCGAGVEPLAGDARARSDHGREGKEGKDAIHVAEDHCAARAIDWRVDGWDRGKDVIDRLFLPGPKRRRPAAKTSVLNLVFEAKTSVLFEFPRPRSPVARPDLSNVSPHARHNARSHCEGDMIRKRRTTERRRRRRRWMISIAASRAPSDAPSRTPSRPPSDAPSRTLSGTQAARRGRCRRSCSDFPTSLSGAIAKSKITLHRLICDEGFPAGILVTLNSRAWTEESVNDWVANRPSAKKELGVCKPHKPAVRVV